MRDEAAANGPRVAVVGDGAAALNEHLVDRRIDRLELPVDPDPFDLADIDATIIADPSPQAIYTQLRDLDGTHPIVIAHRDGDGEIDLAGDGYATVVDWEETAPQTGLLIARVRQLARLPGSGADLSRVASGRRVPLHRDRPREFFALWAGAVLAYGVGDSATTVYGIEVAGLGEQNPFVDGLLEVGGIVGFVALKLAVFALLLAISLRYSRVRNHRHYYWPPLVLIIAGVGLSAWNAVLILG